MKVKCNEFIIEQLRDKTITTDVKLKLEEIKSNYNTFVYEMDLLIHELGCIIKRSDNERD